MWSLHHPVLFLLLYKDVIALLIQGGLLVTTFALIWVGARQAKAAKAQARAANRQVKAAQEQVKAAEAQAKAAEAQVNVELQQLELLRAQVEAANAQSAEMQLQGQAARLPVFKVRERNHAYQNSAAVLLNAGTGPAFEIKWRFLNPKNKNWENRVWDIGTLAATMEMDIPWPDDLETSKLRAGMINEDGISIECTDTAKRRHLTVVKRSKNGEFITYPI
jgi:hypothetical protein